MSRFTLVGASVLALGLLVGSCFGPAIAGRQFSYRDAAHFYYPLYQRVEAEWNAGRVPLWEPEENAGMPLLGNPTAAVLYPGKLIYRALPYPLAARVYVIAHTLLAFAGMVVLARALGIGPAGRMIAGLSYAFGAPILFQYCNIIYLVGAAWAPWAIMAIDAWLRRGKRIAIAGLAAVLTMQVLGGDPQAAYIEGLCGGAYAILIGRSEVKRRPLSPLMKWLLAALAVVTLLAWIGVTLDLAHVLPSMRGRKEPPIPTFPWSKYVPLTVAALWGLMGVVLIMRWRKGNAGVARLGRRLAGLAVAAVLAGALAGAQLLPVLEFSALTGRAADEGTHDIYPFSIEPARLVELIWPNFFGTLDRGNHSWLQLVPPVSPHRIWVPSLYVGGITLALALFAFFSRGGPLWKVWLGWIVVISLLGAVGEHLGPLWMARNFESMTTIVGTHDPLDTNSIRLDSQLRDGDGSFYYLLSTAFPGFQQFRYPSKLLTFTVLGLALLAGYGWDHVEAGQRRGLLKIAGVLFGLSLVGALGVAIGRGPLEEFFAKTQASAFGPIEPAGVWRDLLLAFTHGGLAFAAAVAAALLARRRPGTAAACIIVAVAIDLTLANSRLITTCEQNEFERVPKVVEIIAEAEKADPSPGPFRVHRAPIWNPQAWLSQASTERVNDFVRWERDSIQPKYGLPYGIQYTYTLGVAELYDFEWFFGPFTRELPPAAMKQLRMSAGERAVYMPRRSYNLWNTRYFVLPGGVVATHADRGVYALLQDSVQVYPRPGTFKGPDGDTRGGEWLRNEDLQVLRNTQAMPRAWIVHDARFSPPVEGLSREARRGPMEEMIYQGDAFWTDPDRIVYDPRAIAWIETDDQPALAKFRTGRRPMPSETVTVREVSPVRVELDASLDQPGLVILADVLYPGWTLTIDNKPAPILRANRLMRGAGVDAGKHTLVYEFHPRSFAIGKVASAFGVIGLVVSLIWARREQRTSVEKKPSIGQSKGKKTAVT